MTEEALSRVLPEEARLLSEACMIACGQLKREPTREHLQALWNKLIETHGLLTDLHAAMLDAGRVLPRADGRGT